MKKDLNFLKNCEKVPIFTFHFYFHLQIGAVDHHDSSCYSILLNNIERGNIDLEKFNFWVKHWVVKGHDDFGQTSLHLAAQKGLKRFFFI